MRGHASKFDSKFNLLPPAKMAQTNCQFVDAFSQVTNYNLGQKWSMLGQAKITRPRLNFKRSIYSRLSILLLLTLHTMCTTRILSRASD